MVDPVGALIGTEVGSCEEGGPGSVVEAGGAGHKPLLITDPFRSGAAVTPLDMTEPLLNPVTGDEFVGVAGE